MPVSIQGSDNIGDLGDALNAKLTPSYGYFGYTLAVTIAAGTGVTIPFNTTYMSSGISLSGNAFTFTNAGVYALDWGCRPGTASDVWTVVDLYNSTEGIVGRSFGFGTAGSEVGARTAHFMAEVTNTSVSYNLRITRSSSMAIIEPAETQPEPDYPEVIPSIGLSVWRVG
jgi:hypothetical protein